MLTNSRRHRAEELAAAWIARPAISVRRPGRLRGGGADKVIPTDASCASSTPNDPVPVGF